MKLTHPSLLAYSQASWTVVLFKKNLMPQTIFQIRAVDDLKMSYICPVKMLFLFNPLPDNTILDRSKLKQIEDDIFKFDENSRKLSKRVENTVGKREIAIYEQFPLFPQCFQKACFLEASKGVIVWEWVKLQELQSQFVI